MKRSTEEQKVIQGVALFYWEKNQHDADATDEEIRNVGFRQIECFGENVVFWVKRPGLFIGRRGENIDRLGKALSKKIYIKEVEGDAGDSIICAIEDERTLAYPPPAPIDRHADYESSNPYDEA